MPLTRTAAPPRRRLAGRPGALRAAGRRTGRAGRFLAVAFALALAGCAATLPTVQRTPSSMKAAPPGAVLAGLAAEGHIAPGASGVWPLVQSAFALDARLALIENATTSLDLQCYLIGDDTTGHLLLRAVRDAALRGVRVRLLLDDLYTTDMDRLLLGFAATSNVEVRLFNPFITARASSLRRLVALASDFRRLNHRMHNKLFIADGAAAVIGGRNLADEYFLRGTRGNFVDFDLMAAGAVVPELGAWFDLYWNSEQVYPLQDVVRAAGELPAPADDLQAAFDLATRPKPGADPPPPALDFFDTPALGVQLARHEVRLLPAETRTFADRPEKIDPANHSFATSDTLSHRFVNALGETHDDLLLISPYFIPGRPLLERLAELRRAGVRVRVVTNSLAISDEPLVSIGFERHQGELLDMGVELYEMSSRRLKMNDTLRGLFGNSTGRLHTKMALVDRKTSLIGSMNLDPRSAAINTEIGIAVESPRLAQMIVDGFRIESLVGLYRVQLRPDGRGVRWTALDADSTEEELEIDPETTFWQRIQLLLLSTLVPESQL